MSKPLSNHRIAMIAAQWHGDLVNVATTSCYSELGKLGLEVAKNVELFTVPGSLELPLVAKLLVQTGRWDAIIAFGFVVDGGIYRHEFVAQAILNGLVNVGLETGTPVLSTVLTPQRFDDKNPADVDFFRQHLIKKGAEAARSAVQTIEVVGTVSQKQS